ELLRNGSNLLVDAEWHPHRGVLASKSLYDELLIPSDGVVKTPIRKNAKTVTPVLTGSPLRVYPTLTMGEDQIRLVDASEEDDSDEFLAGKNDEQFSDPDTTLPKAPKRIRRSDSTRDAASHSNSMQSETVIWSNKLCLVFDRVSQPHARTQNTLMTKVVARRRNSGRDGRLSLLMKLIHQIDFVKTRLICTDVW
ncbi:hypothetical protein Ciccas_008049, partial [Cichlidogyrus casuarinus]